MNYTNMKLSATKSVFVLVAVTVCGSFFIGKISEQAFLSLATMVFMSYYKGDKQMPVEIKG